MLFILEEFVDSGQTGRASSQLVDEFPFLAALYFQRTVDILPQDEFLLEQEIVMDSILLEESEEALLLGCDGWQLVTFHSSLLRAHCNLQRSMFRLLTAAGRGTETISHVSRRSWVTVNRKSYRDKLVEVSRSS